MKRNQNEIYQSINLENNISLLFIKKYIILFLLISILFKYNIIIENFGTKINGYYFYIQNNLNITFNNKLFNKIKIGVYGYSIKNGGRARMTSFLVNYFNKIEIFKVYLFTKVNKEKNEYKIPLNIKRFVIKKNLFKLLKKYKIDCLIYELDDIQEINNLNNNKDVKVIFYHHSSNFDWIYMNYSIFKTIYKIFENSKYFVSIVPFENYYLFKKWGIRSIYINDFITFNYTSIIPSDLSENNILMIGRGYAKKKRFQIGIQAMEYLIKEINYCNLYIISNLTGIIHLQNLVINLNLSNNVKFIGYSSFPEIYLKNASLNLFPSISESFGLVLCETKIYGIPNILIGLDYLSISKEGTIIIYDDSSESLSKESIKILKSYSNRRKLGREARNNIKSFNNNLIFNKWIKLILSVFNGDKYYKGLREEDKNIYNQDLFIIAINQIKLLKMRIKKMNNITINDYENLTFLESIEY